MKKFLITATLCVLAGLAGIAYAAKTPVSLRKVLAKLPGTN